MTTTATRTDVHSPTNLVTEDYDFVGYVDLHPDDGRTHWIDQSAAVLDDADTPWANTGQCGHCGARIRYAAIVRHNPTQTTMLVGEQCLGNRFERATTEFQVMRKQATLDRKLQRIKNERLEWFAINPDREVAYNWAAEQVQAGEWGFDGMRSNFVSLIKRNGSTTDKFVAAILRDMVRTERFQAERAIQDAERAAERATAEPVPTANGEVLVGEVVSTKLQENDYGVRVVMTVKEDRGFLVWGTVPAAIDGVEKGDRVEFTANVKPSDRDDKFGFFSRPRKATIMEGVAA